MRVRLFMNAYNATPELEGVLPRLEYLRLLLSFQRIRLEVRLVDDASTDDTWAAITAFINTTSANPGWLHVVQNPQNVGNAQGILQGYAWAMEGADDETFVACCDADGEHNPLDILTWLELHLLDRSYDSAVGSINYPDHLVSAEDRAGMRMLGALQARAAGAAEPFYVHSPGFQIHHAPAIARIVTEVLPRYVQFYTAFRDGQFPRWGLHGALLHLLGAGGVRIRPVYLACYGSAPNRTPERLREQMEAGLRHLQVVEEFLALPGNGLRP